MLGSRIRGNILVIIKYSMVKKVLTESDAKKGFRSRDSQFE